MTHILSSSKGYRLSLSQCGKDLAFQNHFKVFRKPLAKSIEIQQIYMGEGAGEGGSGFGWGWMRGSS